MGRYYRLSKKITDDMATAILNDINELENVQTARITEDNKYLVRGHEGSAVSRGYDTCIEYLQPSGWQMRTFICRF